MAQDVKRYVPMGRLVHIVSQNACVRTVPSVPKLMAHVIVQGVGRAFDARIDVLMATLEQTARNNANVRCMLFVTDLMAHVIALENIKEHFATEVSAFHAEFKLSF